MEWLAGKALIDGFGGIFANALLEKGAEAVFGSGFERRVGQCYGEAIESLMAELADTGWDGQRLEALSHTLGLEEVMREITRLILDGDIDPSSSEPLNTAFEIGVAREGESSASPSEVQGVIREVVTGILLPDLNRRLEGSLAAEHRIASIIERERHKTTNQKIDQLAEALVSIRKQNEVLVEWIQERPEMRRQDHRASRALIGRSKGRDWVEHRDTEPIQTVRITDEQLLTTSEKTHLRTLISDSFLSFPLDRKALSNIIIRKDGPTDYLSYWVGRSSRDDKHRSRLEGVIVLNATYLLTVESMAEALAHNYGHHFVMTYTFGLDKRRMADCLGTYFALRRMQAEEVNKLRKDYSQGWPLNYFELIAEDYRCLCTPLSGEHGMEREFGPPHFSVRWFFENLGDWRHGKPISAAKKPTRS
jgi:hypothetical protein